MIEALLKTAKNPCVLFSGGVDSLLVLYMVRQYKDVDVVTFRQDFTDKQWSVVDRVIREWGLQVWSFPPTRSYVIPNGDTLARVDEYSMGGMTFPVLRDFLHGDRCSLELDKTRLAELPCEFDVIFTGSKRVDHSFATGKNPLREQVLEIGNVKFCQPLFHWTDAEVMAKAKDLNLPFSQEFYELGDESFDSGSIVACSRCLGTGKVYCPVAEKEIDSVDWEPAKMLESFRTKYGFEVKKYVH